MREYTAFFPFGGLGGGALGFALAETHLLGERARFRIVGGLDINAEACADFETLTGVPETCADVSKMTPAELRRIAGATAPDVVFLSAPCKGSSKLISEEKASDPRYQAMNRLALDWIELMLATWIEPPRLVLFENVPNITTRARPMLGAVERLLRRSGYLQHDGYHECGELGGLAQRRKRWLKVARHGRRVPPLLYTPPKRRVRGCGEVLGPLPMPGDPAAGPMHALPAISWLNWVRLALIPAGGDWRDLAGVLEDGQPRREVFRRQHVTEWTEPAVTIAGGGGPNGNGPCAVADPRLIPQAGNPNMHFGKYAVRGWESPTGPVIGATRVGYRLRTRADPRGPAWFKTVLGVVPWTSPAATVTGNSRPQTGAHSVADPRVKVGFDHAYAVLRWNEPSATVAGKSFVGCGAYSVADPRLDEALPLGCKPHAGAYGVIPWHEAAKTITGSANIDNGAFAVADPRLPDAPPLMVIRDIRKPPPAVPIIIAADGTWHRPLTTLELAVLQGLPATVRGAPLKLAGSSVSRWRERIGNAVPAPAAQAIAEQMLITLLSADVGAFSLSSAGGVWVQETEAS